MSPQPFEPVELGPLRLRNRIIKAATFEGLTREHVVNDELIAFHRKAAAGGVGMTTLAYCAAAGQAMAAAAAIEATTAAVFRCRGIISSLIQFRQKLNGALALRSACKLRGFPYIAPRR